MEGTIRNVLRCAKVAQRVNKARSKRLLRWQGPYWSGCARCLTELAYFEILSGLIWRKEPPVRDLIFRLSVRGRRMWDAILPAGHSVGIMLPDSISPGTGRVRAKTSALPRARRVGRGFRFCSNTRSLNRLQFHPLCLTSVIRCWKVFNRTVRPQWGWERTAMWFNAAAALILVMLLIAAVCAAVLADAGDARPPQN